MSQFIRVVKSLRIGLFAMLALVKAYATVIDSTPDALEEDGVLRRLLAQGVYPEKAPLSITLVREWAKIDRNKAGFQTNASRFKSQPYRC